MEHMTAQHMELLTSQGAEDFDQHYTTARQYPRQLPFYEYNESKGEIHINDPVWGRETIGDWEGDVIFGELYTHPVFQRLAAIEQLTLPKTYATMPGSTEFTRWEHAWGSVVFVRKMIREAEAEGRQFDPREKLILQLRTLVSDAAHTSFSHLGDWLRQEFGGAEDSHDQDLTEYLEANGVNDILRRHGIQPEEVIFPDVEDWVECPSPALCVDRVDYGVREIMRWVDPNSSEIWRNAFKIDEDNRLVMKDKQMARYFGSCFGLLATEHWSHPVHRLQLQLFGDIVKGAILDVPPMARTGDALHVIDRLYTIDNDVIANIRALGTLNNDLHALLLDIARAQRRVFAWGREDKLISFKSAYEPRYWDGAYQLPAMQFPHPLQKDTWRLEYSGVTPQNIELIPVDSPDEVEDFGQDKHSLDIFLPALKPRTIDPPYVEADGSRGTASSAYEDYADMLTQIRAIQSQSYAARVYMAPQAKASLEAKLTEIRADWDEAMQRPRTEASKQALSAIMGSIGTLAVASSPNRMQLTW